MLVQDGSREDAEVEAAGDRYRRLAARHAPFAVVVAAAAAVRLIVMLGYQPIMWFNDSYFYLSDAVYRTADTMRPEGYPFLLALLMPLHSLTFVAVLQQLMGLGMGIAIYAVLRHRGLPWWGATLCALPVLFDAYELLLEHLIAADTLFTFCVTMAIVALCWRDRPSWPVIAICGLLIGYADIVRGVGYPLLAAVAIGLLARRAGWRRSLALVGIGVLPVAGYVLWFHHVYGKYAVTESQGTFLYSRVSSFAECSKMNPPASLRVLCDPRPPGQRPGSEAYIWDGGTPLAALTGPDSAKRFTPAVESLTMRFAEQAILHQPLDYAAVVTHDMLRTFGWVRSSSDATGSGPTFQFRSVPKPVPYWATNYPGDRQAQAMYRAQLTYAGPGLGRTTVHSPFSGFVRAYQSIFTLPGTLLGLILLTGLAGVAARWRRWGGLPLLPWLVAALLVVSPPLITGFSYRYVPAITPFACLAAGLAFAGAGDGPLRWLREHGLLSG